MTLSHPTTSTQKLLSVQQRIDVVVVPEGRSDQTTALVFCDIAETVQDGLQDLGHPSRIVYCTNLVTDHCFAKGGKFIILAPHNLASYFTGDGGLAVLEKQLLPPDAGDATLCFQERERETHRQRQRERTEKCTKVI